MNIKNIIVFLFVYLIAMQTANMYIGYQLNSFLILKFTLFEAGLIATLLLLALKLNKFITAYETEVNKFILTVILIYFVYQVIVVAPLLFKDGYTSKQIFYSVFGRTYFLMIPFFYLYLFPSFKNKNTPFKIFNYSGLVLLILLLYKFLVIGYTEPTSTGEIRVAQGNSTILFVLILISNLSLFNREKTNMFFVAVAILGIALSNHKSAYLGIVIIILVTLLNATVIKNKAKIGLHILLFIFLVLIPITQIPFIQQNVVGRITSSFLTDDPNANDRIEHYEMAWSYFTEHPLNGSMLNYSYYSNSSDNRVPPHNFIFQILATQGLIGIAFITTLLLWLIKTGLKNRKDPISLQMTLLIIYYIVFTLFNENFLSTKNIIILNFAAGLILYRNKCIENAKVIVSWYLNEKMTPKYVNVS